LKQFKSIGAVMPEKILIVDDDIDTLKLVGLILQRQGYEVRVSSSGSQALEMMKSEVPDLLLLDIMMPEMDGYEVAGQMRSDQVLAEVPIIMFTAKSQLDDKVAGFEAGADDYLTKPTQPRELLAHIKAVLARTSKSKRPVITAQPTTDASGYMVGILGVKGGLGVSTVTLNLGVAIREVFKKEVIVADFRPGQGTLGLELGFQKAEGLNRLLEYNLNSIGTDEIKSELVMHSSGIRLLLSSHRPSDSKYSSAVPHFESITRLLPFLAKHIVVDLGTSFTPLVEKVAPHFHELVVIVEPVPHSVLQTRLLIDELSSSGVGEGKITIVLVNRFRSGVQLAWSQVQEQLKHNVSVIFTPAPELTYQAAVNGVPVILQQPESLTAQQFQKLAEKVIQQST
jgi:CheY-like chemotaxis protein/MinD-like ATPase involved in chromosome partitioning or flagellar assembly